MTTYDRFKKHSNYVGSSHISSTTNVRSATSFDKNFGKECKLL